MILVDTSVWVDHLRKTPTPIRAQGALLRRCDRAQEVVSRRRRAAASSTSGESPGAPASIRA
jgi:predicted nucleic acid-binding protein